MKQRIARLSCSQLAKMKISLSHFILQLTLWSTSIIQRKISWLYSRILEACLWADSIFSVKTTCSILSEIMEFNQEALEFRLDGYTEPLIWNTKRCGMTVHQFSCKRKSPYFLKKNSRDLKLLVTNFRKWIDKNIHD